MRLSFLDPKDIPIIGLAGPARSGKDTVAQIIKDALDCEVTIDGFSHRMKVAAARSLGFQFDTNKEYLEWADTFKEECSINVEMMDINEEPYMETVKKISGREFLQFFGTEAHRDVFGENFWIDRLLSSYVRYEGLLIVSDVRYNNEAKAIVDLGGAVLRMNRGESGVPGNHPSENPIDERFVNYEIDNNGSLDDLVQKTEWVLDQLIWQE